MSCPSLAFPSLYYSNACIIDSLVVLVSRDLLFVINHILSVERADIYRYGGR